ncbi:MAG: hypothetical protein NTX65_03605 [Ignavibacteriales bacterium]|nr:hypothetical protein [Ignavibacteriales bacterium]
MKSITNTPLVLAFIIVVIIFLLFCGGAITLTLLNGGMNHSMNEEGWRGNITWLWVPTAITFILSVLLGIVIFRKKE